MVSFVRRKCAWRSDAPPEPVFSASSVTRLRGSFGKTQGEPVVQRLRNRTQPPSARLRIARRHFDVSAARPDAALRKPVTLRRAQTGEATHGRCPARILATRNALMSLETVVGSAAWYVRSGEWEAEKSRAFLEVR